MPSTTSSTHQSAPPVPSPSNPVLEATQSQWIFTDSELYRTPSILDGMTLEEEHMHRSKGVNFITQVGILLKLPQLTISTASVYLHRFFMRYSMKDLPQRPGMHPYSVAATALFLATKVEENCRKMKELIVAVCRVAQKKPNLIVDEQSKDFWRWRDTILHNEDLLLEALCFDLQLEPPYRMLYEFMCYLQVQHDKPLRNCAWAFLNDSTFTVLCIQFSPRAIAAGALYAAARHCEVSFEDDALNRPWWEQLGVDIREMKKVCDRMADIYEIVPAPAPSQKYPHMSTQVDDMDDKTRIFHRRKSDSSADNQADSQTSGEINGRKRDREGEPVASNERAQNGDAAKPDDSGRSPKRQRRTSEAENEAGSSFSRSQPSNPASQAGPGINPDDNNPHAHPRPQGAPFANGSHNAPRPNSRIPSGYRPEHPLPPPPPNRLPPSVHDERQHYNDYRHHSRIPQNGVKPPPPPPPPPPGSDPHVDSVQQRIDAICQQGLPPDHAHGAYHRSPPPHDRYGADRRDWDRDRNHGRNRDRYRGNNRDRDYDRSRRSSGASGSASSARGPPSASPEATRSRIPEVRKGPTGLGIEGVGGRLPSPERAKEDTKGETNEKKKEEQNTQNDDRDIESGEASEG